MGEMRAMRPKHLGEKANPGERRYLSRSEVAALFEVSPSTVARWARAGKLPYVVTPGGRRRYPREVVESLARELELQ